jgi:hypothetical protein
MFDAKIQAHENVIQTTEALRDLLMPRPLAGGPPNCRHTVLIGSNRR